MEWDLNTILQFITGGGLATLLASLGVIKLRQKRNGGTPYKKLEGIEKELKIIKGDIYELKTDSAVLKSEVKNLKNICTVTRPGCDCKEPPDWTLPPGTQRRK